MNEEDRDVLRALALTVALYGLVALGLWLASVVLRGGT